MTREKVSLSQTVRLITWILIPVIVIFGLLLPIRDFMHTPHSTMQAMLGCVILLVFLTLCVIFFYAPKEISLTEDRLILTKGASRLTLRYADIQDVRMYDPRSTGNIRVFGIGGIFGYVGRYYNRDIGYYTSYVGDYSQAFLLETRTRKKYLLSCDRAARMVEEIRKHIHEH